MAGSANNRINLTVDPGTPLASSLRGPGTILQSQGRARTARGLCVRYTF